MSRSFARILLTLPLVFLLAGSQSQFAFAKGKQTAGTKNAEDKCVRQSGACLKKCDEYYRTPEGRQSCEKRCGDKVNACLNNVAAISVDPATRKQTVKQNPAVATQTAPFSKGTAAGQGMQRSGGKR